MATVYSGAASSQRRDFVGLISVIIGFLALAAVLWLPIGIHKTGLIEEWSVYRSIDQGQSIWANEYFAGQYNRILGDLIYYAGYWLTPGSFVGLNYLFFLIVLGKGILFWGLLRRLNPAIPVLNFMVALLFIIYPADIAILNIRFPGYHVAIFFYLMAVNLLLMYWKHPSRAVMLGIWIALIMCLFNVEVAFPLVCVSPSLLFLRERRITRRLVSVTALWFVAPLLFVIVTFITFKNPVAYQAGLLVAEPIPANQQLMVYGAFLAVAQYRSFVHSWIETIDRIKVSSTGLFVMLSLTFSAIVAACGLLQFRLTQKQPPPANSPYYPRVILLGAAVVALGFLPFLPVPQRNAVERTYLMSSLGAALSLVVVILAISRIVPYRNVVFTLVTSAVLGVAVLGALLRHQELLFYSLREQSILAQFASQ